MNARPDLVPAAEVLNGHRDFIVIPGGRKTLHPIVASAAQLQHKHFPDIQFIVPRYVAPGLTLLAAKPKIGKSWLCLDIAISVATGRYCLGDIRCSRGQALVIALEDNERRLKRRLAKLLPSEEWPADLVYATEWPRAGEGGVEAIRKWCEAASNPQLVVVDVLAAFREPKRAQQSPYEADYEAIKGLQEVASEFNVAVIVIHHMRKAAADSDPFDTVSGTLGLSGAADSVMILSRDGQGTTLYVRGRDLETCEDAIAFNSESCRWTIQGAAADIRRSDERGSILSVLIDADEPMTVSEIATGTEMPRNSVDQLLFKMFRAGEVKKAGRGLYLHPSKPDPLSPHKNAKNIRSAVAEEWQ
jgi:RecA-family ATPase